MATHSNILAGRIPWTEEPGRLQSIGSHIVEQDCSDLAWIQLLLYQLSFVIFSQCTNFPVRKTNNNNNNNNKNKNISQIVQERYSVRGIGFTGFLCVVLFCIQLFATPRTIAHQAPVSMEFSRQEYWNGLSFPSSVQVERIHMLKAILL